MTTQQAMKGDLIPLYSRAQIYRLLSIAFYHPSDTLIQGLRDGSFQEALTEATRNLSPASPLRDRLNHLGRTIRSAVSDDLRSIFSEYHALFGTDPRDSLTPYETDYTTSDVFVKSNELADIAGFYRAFGLKPSKGDREREDHISVELEFMHQLISLEAHARRKRWKEKASVCLDAQKKFLTSHLGTWKLIMQHQKETKPDLTFYNSLGQFTEAFLASEAKFLEANLPSRELNPQPLSSPDEATFGCDDSCPYI